MKFKSFKTRVCWLVLLVLALQFSAISPAHAAGASAQNVQNTVNSDAFRVAYIQRVGASMLGRALQAGEIAPLTAAMKDGAQGWQNVAVLVAASPSYFQRADNSNPKFVAQLFQDFTGRVPDATEETPAALDFLKTGSRADLAQVVADTDEFRALTAHSLYQMLLHRAPNDAESSAAVTQLSAGGLNALATKLLASPEYYARGGSSPTGWQNAVQSDLSGDTSDDGTMPATNPMPATNVDYPATTPAVPQSNSARETMVQALLASPEYAAALVQSTYQKFLHRAATPAELQSLGGAASDQITMAVLTSDEYFNRAGGTTTGYLNQLSKDLFGKAGGKNGLPSKGDLLDLLRNKIK